MRTRIRVIFTLLAVSSLTLFFSEQSFAQKKKSDTRVTRTLIGTVNAGEPFPGSLPGATVFNTKTNQGVVTDSDGKYSIGITGPEDILVFSFLGYKDLNHIAGVDNRLDVVLENAQNVLDETVVIGYGTTKKGISPAPSSLSPRMTLRTRCQPTSLMLCKVQLPVFKSHPVPDSREKAHPL